ncbi:hypothetical protein HK105_203138 [Polyrhizophydium stewartii]|uniref:AB hydrolase-1 domain-containing protein n=1 Tax=Polyrhizophydium stewartii TaxID=2732419 RepID=A0ABR4ND94_9FUNG
MGDLRQSYRFLGPKLVAHGVTTIAVDLRGTGESSTDFQDFGIAAIASDVIAILDAEGITQPAVIMGNSYTAAVAVYLAGTHPERVAAIVGLSGFYRPMPADTYFRPMSHVLFTTLYGTTVWVGYFKGLFKASPLPADMPEYIAAVKKIMSAEPIHAVIIGKYGRESKAPAWEAADLVNCPSLILLGSQDPDFGDQAAELETVRSKLAGNGQPKTAVTAALVPGTGHYPHAEDPEFVFKSIAAFFAAHALPDHPASFRVLSISFLHLLPLLDSRFHGGSSRRACACLANI